MRNLFFYFYRLILILLFSQALMLNLFASTEIMPTQNETLNYLLVKINNRTIHYKSTLEILTKFDKKRAKEFHSFMTTHPELKNFELKSPTATIENEKIKISISGKDYFFSFLDNDEIVVFSGNQKVVLTYNMSLSQMMKIISGNLTNNKVGFLNLFIPDANAFEPIFAAVIIALVLLCYHSLKEYFSTFKTEKFNAAVEETKALCQRLNNSSSSNITVDDLKKIYNESTDKFLKPCSDTASICKTNSYDCRQNIKAACEKIIPEIKRCLKNSIKQLSSVGTNNSSRGIKKETDYDVVKDKYIAPTGVIPID